LIREWIFPRQAPLAGLVHNPSGYCLTFEVFEVLRKRRGNAPFFCVLTRLLGGPKPVVVALYNRTEMESVRLLSRVQLLAANVLISIAGSYADSPAA
jgi:hypothetical protein